MVSWRIHGELECLPLPSSKEEAPILDTDKGQGGNLDFFPRPAVRDKAEPLPFPMSEKAS